jgi:nicotinamide riboside transporter PnuC
MKALEIFIVVLSMAGSLIISFAGYGMVWGFAVYIVANILATVFFYKKELYYMVCLQLFFLLTSINGLWRTF